MADDGVLKSEDEVDYPPNKYIYSVIDMGFVLFGVGTLLLDWGTDMWTAYKHWCRDDIAWFSLTVAFMGLSSLVIMGVCLHWFYKDNSYEEMSRGKRTARLVLILLQLGLLLRYCDTFYYGWKSRKYWKQGNNIPKQKEHYTRMLYEDSDSVFLRMFECFLESAPQLVLQLYVLTQIPVVGDSSQCGENLWYVIFLGAIISLISLAWGVMAYARGSRFTNEHKNNISICGSFFTFLWHIFCLAARVTALVLFASHFQLWVLGICTVHWLVMVSYLLLSRYFSEGRFSDVGMSCLLGAVYIFVFLNDKDEPTRWKYRAYYTLWALENMFMVVMFLVYADIGTWYRIPAVVFHFVTFALGLTFMAIYYWCLHPSRCPPQGSGSLQTTS